MIFYFSSQRRQWSEMIDWLLTGKRSNVICYPVNISDKSFAETCLLYAEASSYYWNIHDLHISATLGLYET